MKCLKGINTKLFIRLLLNILQCHLPAASFAVVIKLLGTIDCIFWRICSKLRLGQVSSAIPMPYKRTPRPRPVIRWVIERADVIWNLYANGNMYGLIGLFRLACRSKNLPTSCWNVDEVPEDRVCAIKRPVFVANPWRHSMKRFPININWDIFLDGFQIGAKQDKIKQKHNLEANENENKSASMTLLGLLYPENKICWIVVHPIGQISVAHWRCYIVKLHGKIKAVGITIQWFFTSLRLNHS